MAGEQAHHKIVIIGGGTAGICVAARMRRGGETDVAVIDPAELLAEFDYTMKPHRTIPLINTQQERYDMWLLKRYGLRFMYWNLMLKGRA